MNMSIVGSRAVIVVVTISILSLAVSTLMYATNTAYADIGQIYFVTATEACEDGIDNDGDGDTDYQDAINCPLGPIRPEPSGPEICGDGLDNDHDGNADRWDLGDCQTCYHDKTCPGGPVNPGDPSPFGPQPTHGLLLFEKCMNGVDDDRDGIIDQACPRGLAIPMEKCSNNIDDNYDGRVDEPVTEHGIACIPYDQLTIDQDGDGFTLSTGDCNDNNANVFPGATEVAANGIDDDCDDLVDNISTTPPNTDTTTTSPSTPTPTTPDPNVDEDGDGFSPTDGDCDDSRPFVYPGSLDYANGVDDDCDGIVDDDDVDSSNSDTSTTTGLSNSGETATGSASTEFTQLVEEGVNLLDLERYDEAIEYFDRALEIDPTDSTTLYNKATALNNQGVNLSNLERYDEAIEYFDRALEIDPTDSTTLYNKATALNDKGVEFVDLERYDEAIEYFDRALEIDPTDSTTLSNKETALVNKASDLASLGRYEEAIEVIDEALSILPNDDVALSNKGAYLAQVGSYDEAIEYFDRALTINPGNTEASESRDAVMDVLENGATLEMSTTIEESDA